jgi:hypothetical protein
MSSRGLALIAVALVLSAGLVGVQLASGGADFVPQRPADPCQDRPRTNPDEDDLEGLAEAIVLTGVDEAACKLGVSRERLLLALPSQKDRAALARETGTDERGLAQALKDGLRTGIDRLDKAGQLPKTSALLPSVADQLGISKSLVGAIPDSVVDDLLPTADVLRRAVDKIDMNVILANLDDREALESTLRDALVQAAIDELREQVTDALPGPLQGLLG